MSNSVTVVIRNLTTGAGTSGLTVKLRRQNDNYASDYLTASAVVGKSGVYRFDNVPYNKYKLWVNGTEDDTFGGTNGRWLPEGDEVIRLDSGGVYWDAKEKRIENVADVHAATDALNRQSGDARFVKLDGSNDPSLWLPAGTDPLDLSGREVTVAAATDDAHPVQKVQLDDAVTTLNDAIAAIVVTPYQESVNVVNLIPGGIQETGKNYNSYALAQNYCRGYASNTHRYTINVKGAGTGGTDIIATNGAISGNATFNNYISLKGMNQNIRLLVDDDTFSVSAGKVMIENLTLARDDDGAGTPSFANFIFKDVYFDFDCLSLSFNGCTFRNCFIKNTGSINFTSCKGGGVITNGTLPASIQGWGEISSSDF